MIPGNSFTPVPVVSPFTFPDNLPYSPLSDTVMGGVALNNGSQGRMVQLWTAWYDGAQIRVQPTSGSVVFSLPVAGVLTLSLAFDQSMALALAYQTAAGSNLYYFNTLTSSYTTLTLPGTTSCRACVDNPANFYAGSSDIIFAYTAGGNLSYRQQRDRYTIEYPIGATGTKKLNRMGLNTGNRLQFELR